LTYIQERRFEWDPFKDRQNRSKHGISFAEAIEVFRADDLRVDLFDTRHSLTEDRFISLGPIEGGLVLVVWTQRNDDVIRLVTARRPTTQERRLYRRRMESQP
jgi:uncharacterized DUF497 family protein